MHPLDPLTATEIASAVRIARRDRELGERVRFVTVTLREPPKETVRAWTSGAPVERIAELVVLDPAHQASFEGLVSLTGDAVVAWERVDGVQPAIMVEEYEECERLVREHPDFLEALRRRGLEDQLDLVCVDPVPPGNWDRTERRICRALAWMRPYPDGNTYARPIEGIVAVVDLHRGEVISVTDHGAVPVPDADPGEYRSGHLPIEEREAPKPLEIIQREGPSFVVDGWQVRWQKWRLRVGFTAREGLVLHEVGYEDGGRVRSIMHRASICEMAVPYADPTPTRHIQGPLDIGENLVGTLVNSLELGCDCLGLIHYFDVDVNDSRGEVVHHPNAICLHEEDYGVLWKHWDFRNDHTEVRRSRRLVVSSMSTIGNYEYGFFWYLYQDGTIEHEVKLTGIVSTGAVAPGETPKHGTLVAPGLQAMYHQHFFSARLDFDLDGEANAVVQVDSVPTTEEEDPYGNGFSAVRRLYETELDAPSDIDLSSARAWLVVNRESTNAVGQPVAYKLLHGENARLFSRPGSPQHRRAGFAHHHVWVTRYDPSERYAAGDYPNQHEGMDGLPRWVAQDRRIADEDIVLWYSFGHHHIPRPEDWPVMPTAYIGFTLKPAGFFDRNPALDVPPSATAHCH
ncbi:primary-amine oxidase [Capillimicrobium parvum]|uniref:Amine oxidase n=1 Tax=Capillimicrobium parvum TaxID=2884022 RepID=A0A9E6XS79_9ACTN|nr:primary-amine oxidase [Capillimicrobium parvum]UGS33830.1 Copper methylamine oxidase [Capillimicrobium parvum]